MWPFSRKSKEINTADQAIEKIMQISVDSLPAGGIQKDWTGSKYDGGLGYPEILNTDFETLQLHSAALFRKNLYAKGILRRLITNEINTGLTLESTPYERLLGYQDDELTDWSEDLENRWEIYAANPKLCDYLGSMTQGAKQRLIRLESLIEGDVLVVLDIDDTTGIPRTHIYRGSEVITPPDKWGDDTIKNGVKVDENGRHVGFYVYDSATWDYKYVPAYGSESGRRLAWLVYGSEMRANEVRGEPFLAVVIQALREIDRIKDAVLRKSLINSILALFIQKDEDKPGTRVVASGARRKTEYTPDFNPSEPDRRFKIAGHMPGMVVEELQTGEKPVVHASGNDVNFGPFEMAIVQSLAWGNEIPPEILTLAFSNNYSASQAAINEFKIYLNKARTIFGEQYLTPLFIEWFTSEVLYDRVKAPGFIESIDNPAMYTTYGAWISCDWAGAIKPSTDIVKQVKGYAGLVSEGWITNERAARELTGTKFSKNIKRIKNENRHKREAREILELSIGVENGETSIN